MNDVAAELSNSRIIASYRERTPGSAELAKKPTSCSPAGSPTTRATSIRMACSSPAPRPAQVGRRWPPLYRLFWRPRCVAAGSSPPGRDRGGARGAGRRHAVWRVASARSAVGACDPAPGPIGRAAPLHLVGHRGDADGGAAGARVHRQAYADAAEGAFPWLARPDGQRLHQPLRWLADAGRAAGRGRKIDPVEPGRSRRDPRRLRRRQRHRGGDLRADRFVVRPGAAGGRVRPGTAGCARSTACC